ncbi:MAG TPA: hypothetical protein PLG27_00440, partial [Candidatus Latescibacteria bacterium]|nr:hypothetical protein [Candidatus Latescibacterota bacterium]
GEDVSNVVVMGDCHGNLHDNQARRQLSGLASASLGWRPGLAGDPDSAGTCSTWSLTSVRSGHAAERVPTCDIRQKRRDARRASHAIPAQTGLRNQGGVFGLTRIAPGATCAYWFVVKARARAPVFNGPHKVVDHRGTG